jgi:UDP-N-acetylmuramoyl-tripeptide--D-alanyl-D-alanine ligase
MIFSVSEVLKATGARLLQGEKGTSFPGVSTDSRSLREGELFFALRGSRFDGHRYAVDALGKKAGGVVVLEARARSFFWGGYAETPVFAVGDTLRALGDLAQYGKRRQGFKVVALTGSNGKTTTKDMIAACLETAFPVLKTKGNLNNLIGLPLTLLSGRGDEKVAVLEMGMNVPGEIGRLTEIAEPDVGLITNIERVHLEGLGSIEKLTEEKGALFRGMKQDGLIVVNGDDARVVDLAGAYPGRKVIYGYDGHGDVTADDVRIGLIEGPGGDRIGTLFRLQLAGESTAVRLPLPGRHFVANALAAAAVAGAFGVGLEGIREGLERFSPTPMRMEVVPLSCGVTLINDAYNANPRSVEAALETLFEAKGSGRALVVLGEMLELGDYTEEGHRQVGRKAGALGVDFLVAVGKGAPAVVEGAVGQGLASERTVIAGSREEAAEMLKERMKPGDWVLVKGSRGAGMEKIAEALKEGSA